MIRINLSPEPQWLDLGHGARLQLLPLTTALMEATRSDTAVQDLAADASNDRAGRRCSPQPSPVVRWWIGRVSAMRVEVSSP